MDNQTLIVIQSKRKKRITIERAFPNARIIDLTSKGQMPWVKFSPFYPHGGIPVPFSPNVTAQSVEGIWQGLKVFENVGIDLEKLSVTSMKGLKRTVRRYGRVLGHQKGINGTELLDYLTARIQIYLPAYKWVLENKLSDEISQLKQIMGKNRLVLLDYETNEDLENLAKPLSHAGLVKRYLLSNALYP